MRMLTSGDDGLLHLARLSGYEPKRFFEHADLQGVNLAGQDLRGLSFRGADLRRSDLSDIKWDPGAFDGAKLSADVELTRSTLFSGVGLRVVDSAGRVTLPAFLRHAIRYTYSRKLVVTLNVSGPCIAVYDPQTFETRSASEYIHEEPGGRRLTSEGVSYDKRGRITIPAILRAEADVGDLALFMGIGIGFEIWGLDVARRSSQDSLRAVATYLAQERKRALGRPRHVNPVEK